MSDFRYRPPTGHLIQDVYKRQSLDSAKQGTATLTPGDYSYEVKCDNYNINLNPGKNVFTCSESDSQPIVIVLSNAEILNSVGGKFSAGQVETKSILVNDTAELFAAVDAAAWESVIQWETADPAKEMCIRDRYWVC